MESDLTALARMLLDWLQRTEEEVASNGRVAIFTSEITTAIRHLEQHIETEVTSKVTLGSGDQARRLSWRELYAHEQPQWQRAYEMQSILTDLNRCQHGRHEGDRCGGCHGPSLGNPLVTSTGVTRVLVGGESYPVLPRQIGWGLGGQYAICVPERANISMPPAWKQLLPLTTDQGAKHEQ